MAHLRHLIALGATAAALVASATASAAVTASNVTTPADQRFVQIDVNTPQSLEVEGTFTGDPTDSIQIACVASSGDATALGPPQSVSGDSFNVSAPLANLGNQPQACAIEALPSGATTGDPPTSQTSFR